MGVGLILLVTTSENHTRIIKANPSLDVLFFLTIFQNDEERARLQSQFTVAHTNKSPDENTSPL